MSTSDVFGGQRVVLFALPGAFTPACSESHLPGYEQLYDDLTREGVDRIVCLAVNDAFVMYQWSKSLGIQRVEMLPDGNGEFTRKMGMLVERRAQGMGLRSWRYSMFVENCSIKKLFAEPNLRDNPPGVPVNVSSAQQMLDFLRS
jgi:peroxiredoxin